LTSKISEKWTEGDRAGGAQKPGGTLRKATMKPEESGLLEIVNGVPCHTVMEHAEERA